MQHPARGNRLGLDSRDVLQRLAALVFGRSGTGVGRGCKTAESDDFLSDVHGVPSAASVLTEALLWCRAFGHRAGALSAKDKVLSTLLSAEKRLIPAAGHRCHKPQNVEEQVVDI